MTHTKGPWFVDGDGVTSDALHQMDCIVEYVYGPKANARLIAAAPELLEALRSIALLSSCDESRNVAQAAIDKAKGQIQ